jgi:hypothetical protein
MGAKVLSVYRSETDCPISVKFGTHIHEIALYMLVGE